MQLMTDHHHSTTKFRAQIFNQTVKLGLPGLVQPLRRLIQHQNIRLHNQRARQQNPLHLPARKPLKTAPLQGLHTNTLQSPLRRRLTDTPWHIEKAAHRHRQARLKLKFLRHIADRQACRMADLAAIRLQNPSQHAQQGRFARAVRSHNGHDLTGINRNVHALQNNITAKALGKPACLNQAHAPASGIHLGQSPSASITRDSI